MAFNTTITGLSNKVAIKSLEAKEVLKYVEKTKDQTAFFELFDHLENQVRSEIFNLGSEVREVRQFNKKSA